MLNIPLISTIHIQTDEAMLAGVLAALAELEQAEPNTPIRGEAAGKLRAELLVTGQRIEQELTYLEAAAAVIDRRTPADALNPPELARASLLAEYFRQDCEASNLGALVDRLGTAIFQNDKIALYNFTRFLPDRLNNEAQKTLSDNEQDLLWKLDALTRRASAALVPPRLDDKAAIDSRLTVLQNTRACCEELASRATPAGD